jgi:putative ABC transport system ATP-binding protein
VADDPIIRLRDVQKSYGTGVGGTHVLRGVSFDVGRGEFLALVGQSGSGKSTLLNIIGGLDVADAGRVEVMGHDYGKTPEQELARLRNGRIGFVFQAFNLLDHLTCLGNVTLPAMFAPRGEGGAGHVADRGMDALRRVQMADLAHRKPAELSGGQKQRVAIARALFSRPSLLLCDEPTGNLDSETGREVIEFFRELNRDDGVTLIIVTHEHRVSSVAQRIIGMQDGLLVEGSEVAAGAGPS